MFDYRIQRNHGKPWDHQQNHQKLHEMNSNNPPQMNIKMFFKIASKKLTKKQGFSRPKIETPGQTRWHQAILSLKAQTLLHVLLQGLLAKSRPRWHRRRSVTAAGSAATWELVSLGSPRKVGCFRYLQGWFSYIQNNTKEECLPLWVCWWMF